MNSFLAALRFLTIIPVAGKQNAKVSVLTGFPLVGCLLGLLLATLAAVLLQFMSATVAAALTLLLWVVLTGALHIDAVGDSFDALLGGVGSRERSLKIMKDPLLGAAGAAAIALLLILKFVLLQEMLLKESYVFLLAPVFARSVAVFLFRHTRYVSESGMAEGWGSQHAVSMAAGVLVLSSLALWFVAGPGLLVVLALVIAAVYFCWRRLWQQRIGGFTGDTAGAMIELQEVAVLLILIQV